MHVGRARKLKTIWGRSYALNPACLLCGRRGNSRTSLPLFKSARCGTEKCEALYELEQLLGINVQPDKRTVFQVICKSCSHKVHTTLRERNVLQGQYRRTVNRKYKEDLQRISPELRTPNSTPLRYKYRLQHTCRSQSEENITERTNQETQTEGEEESAREEEHRKGRREKQTAGGGGKRIQDISDCNNNRLRKSEEPVRNLMDNYKPWGRPGAGAPTDDTRKKKFTELQMPPIQNASYKDDFLQFGRPGYGAPLRTKSGRVRTKLGSDIDIWFSGPNVNTGSVPRKATDSEQPKPPEEKGQTENSRSDQEKPSYQLVPVTKPDDVTRNDTAASNESSTSQTRTQLEPINGASERMSSSLNGMRVSSRKSRRDGFVTHRPTLWEKLGYQLSDISHNQEAVQSYRDALNRSLQERIQRDKEENRRMKAAEGVELAPLFDSLQVGKPRRDRYGEMAFNSLPSTDVTQTHDPNYQSSYRGYNNVDHDKNRLRDELTKQSQARLKEELRQRDEDMRSQEQHFSTWTTYWGRPGYGAPKDSHNKKNLMAMLTSVASKSRQPSAGLRRVVREIAASRGENCYEFDPRHVVGKREFVSRTPFATMG